MKVGILGGTFDPVHNGHIAIAKKAKEQYGLDIVFLMPARIPPHKADVATADVHRLAMLTLALSTEPSVDINLMEFERDGRSYTSDTLTILMKDHPDGEIYYIMGEDSLRDFPKWHEPETIASLAKILVAPREENTQSFQDLIAQRNEEYGNVFYPLDLPYNPVSSTALRECLESGKPSPEIPARVADYCRRFGVYTKEPTILRKETIELFDLLRERLAKKLHMYRIWHVTGVAYTAANLLAERYESMHRKPCGDGCYDEVQDAFIAGILHDCAKCMSIPELVAYAKENNVPHEEEQEKVGDVLHAPVGRYMAEHEYGITNPVVLDAIGKHCLGDVEMNDVDLAVYDADYFEPYRDHRPIDISLSELRNIALNDITVGAYEVTKACIRFLETIGATICSQSYRVLEALKKRLNTKNTASAEEKDITQKENESTMNEYTSKDLAKTAFLALEDKKGFDVRVIEIEKVSTIADYFVIADGSNASQVEAMVDEVQMRLYRDYQVEPKRIEGAKNSGWILLDYGDIVVHVFSSEDRLFYDLERVWRDGTTIDTAEWSE
ncbi:MAG: nicotinate (nicotinamide) nucleotide adenylyltransferase [Lachnospiraceae bacterium]|nr:nicotinate (nicotinamide) nucleotide adenylyltransferase [Lachnospiraceae bacterium]